MIQLLLSPKVQNWKLLVTTKKLVGIWYAGKIRLVNLIGSADSVYRLKTRSVNAEGKGEIFWTPTVKAFPLGQWVRISVEVDGGRWGERVRTYQDGELISEGSFVAPKFGIAGFHCGLYAYRVRKATVLNDNIQLIVY